MITFRVEDIGEFVFDTVDSVIEYLKNMEDKEISGFIEFDKFSSDGVLGNSSLVFGASSPESLIFVLERGGSCVATGSL